jgi:hypothetical protein
METPVTIASTSKTHKIRILICPHEEVQQGQNIRSSGEWQMARAVRGESF